MRLYSTSASFTRPNNASVYASGQLVADTALAGNVTPMTFSVPSGFLLTAVKIKLTGSSSNTNAQFSVHLYQFKPGLNSGDRGTFQTTTESGYLGNVYVDCTQFPVAGTDVVGLSPVDPNLIPIFTDTISTANGPTTNIYGLLRSEASYTPTANEVITVYLMGMD